jgi:hypothetical protein
LQAVLTLALYCSIGCNYIFLSQADKDRHLQICHHDENRLSTRMEQQRKRRGEIGKEGVAQKRSSFLTFYRYFLDLVFQAILKKKTVVT